MMNSECIQLRDRLREALGEDRVRESEPMARHTSFQAGGPCELYLEAATVQEISLALEEADGCGVPVTLLGRGTNVLVSDEGLPGLVLVPALEELDVEGTRITAGAGVSLSALARRAREQGLAGLAFAAGIPGTVGGAMVMNAGAYGGEMKDVTESCLVMERTHPYRVRRLGAEELDFSYRHSIFHEQELIALETVFSLQPGDPEEILAQMQDFGRRRSEKQPLEYPSAGSTFKRPPGNFAGKLIQEAGLSGFQVGGARVSEKHCGFVINAGGATASDVYRLTEEVIRRVYEHAGIRLEREVILLGGFS